MSFIGEKSLINMMNTHLERTASHLFSPVELKFAMDFDVVYLKQFPDFKREKPE